MSFFRRETKDERREFFSFLYDFTICTSFFHLTRDESFFLSLPLLYCLLICNEQLMLPIYYRLIYYFLIQTTFEQSP